MDVLFVDLVQTILIILEVVALAATILPIILCLYADVIISKDIK